MILKLFCVLLSLAEISCDYTLDNGPAGGRTYDGIGGLSGGGATSKLLINYPEKQQSEILDYLFKPNYGASLQIFKVEIGGDSQSTDGTESSHMHENWDENYKRGYEWQLMVEAKRRNPKIKLYGLPWAFPGWIGEGKHNPYVNPNMTADYVIRWIKGAKQYYDLTLDYIGIWNERPYDVKYVKVLRDMLDKNGLDHIQLVVGDGGWGVTDDIEKDAVFAKAVDFIGVHYPGTTSTEPAVKTGKQLWSSEDYSTFNDNVGAGCWARILNQNYVNGYMTSTISWNLIASYYPNLPFGRDGLMTAQEPWSGHYAVESPIWMTAHTTQFTEIGWKYLAHGSGVGHLEKGGSYVTLVSPDNKDLTIVIETMNHDHSVCIRPGLPAYTVAPQTATFHLKGLLANITSLNAWYSKLKFDGSQSTLFSHVKDIQVQNGSFSVDLDVDVMYTLSTRTNAKKGDAGPIPLSNEFPLPYQDDYDSYDEFSEAFNFAPQTGVWEVRDSHNTDHKMINRQVILNKPVFWCDTQTMPINIGGSYNWSGIYIQTDVMIPSVNGTTGVFIGARIKNGGCGAGSTLGIFLFVFPQNSTYYLTNDIEMKNIVTKGVLHQPMKPDKWSHLSLIVRGTKAYGFYETDVLFQANIPTNPTHGFAAYGTTSFGIADFDNLKIQSSSGLKVIDQAVKEPNSIGDVFPRL